MTTPRGRYNGGLQSFANPFALLLQSYAKATMGVFRASNMRRRVLVAAPKLDAEQKLVTI